MSVQDAPLIAAVQQGDQQALASLYDAYSGALYGVIDTLLKWYKAGKPKGYAAQ